MERLTEKRAGMIEIMERADRKANRLDAVLRDWMVWAERFCLTSHCPGTEIPLVGLCERTRKEIGQ